MLFLCASGSNLSRRVGIGVLQYILVVVDETNEALLNLENIRFLLHAFWFWRRAVFESEVYGAAFFGLLLLF